VKQKPEIIRILLNAFEDRKLKIQHWVALFVGAVIVVLLVLSLDHLAQGLKKMADMVETGEPRPLWHHYAMAVGFDLGLLGSELGIIVATVLGIKGARMAFTLVLAGTVCVSGFMNGMSMTNGLEPWTFYWYVGAVLGGVIPVLVLLLSKGATSLVVGELDERIKIFFRKFEFRGYNPNYGSREEGQSKDHPRRPRSHQQAPSPQKEEPKKPEPKPAPQKQAAKAKVAGEIRAAGTVKPEPAMPAATPGVAQ